MNGNWRAFGAVLALSCSGRVAVTNHGDAGDAGTRTHGGPRYSGTSGEVATDGTAVYWFDGAGDLLKAAPGNTGPQQKLATDPAAYWLNPGATEIFWVSGNLAVKGVPLLGGDVVEFAKSPGGPVALVAAADRIFYDQGDAGGFTVMEQKLPARVARLVFHDNRAGEIGLAMDAENLYATHCSKDGVLRVPLAGGNAVVLAHETYCPLDIAVDEQFAYFVDYPPGFDASVLILHMWLYRVSLDGGVPEPLVELGSHAFALDAASVYVIGSASILRLPKKGGTPTTLAPTSNANGIAVDGDYVYWTEHAGGTVTLRTAAK
jgi:hypothetical protein